MLNKKAVFVSTASQVIVRFATLVFTLVSIKLLTGYLGTTGVGEYNTITTYLNFFVVIADLGLFSVTVREIAKDPSRERKILSNVLVIRTVSALIATVVACGIVFLTKYDANIKFGVLIASGFLFFNLLASIYDMVLQYRMKMQYSALAEFLSKIIAIGALWFIIYRHGSFLAIISTVALSGVLIFIFKWLFSKKFASLSFKYNAKIARWIFNISIPIGLVFIINNLFFKLDTLMLFAIKGAAAVGIYSVAFKVLEVTIFVGSYFASALKPVIAENIVDNKEYLGQLIRKAINVMIFVSLPIALVCVVFSKEIILFLSTPDFISGSRALLFLSLTLPLIYLDALLGEILIANDERKLLVRVAIFILLFNFLTNLFFIPRYSFMGAAFTTFLSELVLLGINVYYTRKVCPYKIDFKLIGKMLLVILVCFLVLMMLKLSGIYFLILIPIIAIIYALLSWAFEIYSPKNLLSLIKPGEDKI